MEYSELFDIIRSKTKKVKFTDTDISIALQEVEQAIKNYCQISEIPVALKFILCNMTVDLLFYTHEFNAVSDDVLESIDASDVSKLDVGDVSITLGGGTKTQRGKILNSHTNDVDLIIMNYTKQLNNFRRLW